MISTRWSAISLTTALRDLSSRVTAYKDSTSGFFRPSSTPLDINPNIKEQHACDSTAVIQAGYTLSIELGWLDMKTTDMLMASHHVSWGLRWSEEEDKQNGLKKETVWDKRDTKMKEGEVEKKRMWQIQRHTGSDKVSERETGKERENLTSSFIVIDKRCR